MLVLHEYFIGIAPTSNINTLILCYFTERSAFDVIVTGSDELFPAGRPRVAAVSLSADVWLGLSRYC